VEDTSLYFPAQGIFTPGMLTNLSAIETDLKQALDRNGDLLRPTLRKKYFSIIEHGLEP
jgi:hypothetical protein